MGKYYEHYSSETKKLIRDTDKIKKLKIGREIDGINKFVRDANIEMFIDRYKSKYKRNIKKYSPKENKYQNN